MKTTWRVAAVSVLLILTAAYVRLNPPAELDLGPGSLAAFPLELAGWTGTDQSFDQVVTEELDADETLSRSYVKDGDTIWFMVIFHQNERYGAHEPLVCYRSQGWSVVEQGTRTLKRPDDEFDANWILVESRGQKRVALYWWYTAGDLATGDRDQFFARMARSGILSNVTFGAFVRVSTIVRGGDVDAALNEVTEFAESALADLPALFDANVED
ncbi:MAG: exosortase C-terminal domain/associated protein EpsI [Candidatus Eisenbacteria bacterium]